MGNLEGTTLVLDVEDWKDIIFLGLMPLLSVGFGAGAAILTQAYFLRRQERDARLALACSITFKLQAISSFLLKMRQHVVGAEAEAKKRSWDLWRAMSNISGLEHDPVVFQADELALFAVRGDAAFANTLSELSNAHRILLNQFDDYHRKRNEFAVFMDRAGEVAATGSVVTLSTSSGLAGLHMMQLRDLANGIREIVLDSMDDAVVATNVLSKKLQAALGDKRFKLKLELVDPSARPPRNSGGELPADTPAAIVPV